LRQRRPAPWRSEAGLISHPSVLGWIVEAVWLALTPRYLSRLPCSALRSAKRPKLPERRRTPAIAAWPTSRDGIVDPEALKLRTRRLADCMPPATEWKTPSLHRRCADDHVLGRLAIALAGVLLLPFLARLPRDPPVRTSAVSRSQRSSTLQAASLFVLVHPVGLRWEAERVSGPCVAQLGPTSQCRYLGTCR
jgi:hypothetical protein